MAATYSIVAMDPDSGEMGAAVQSNIFAVGHAVLWARAGTGTAAMNLRVELGEQQREAANDLHHQSRLWRASRRICPFFLQIDK